MRTTAETTANRPVSRHLVRRALAGLLAGAASLAVVVGGIASPASAATPRYTNVNCGWYIQPHAAGGFADLKVSTVGLPSVTGSSTASQLVWVYVEFVHPSTTGPVAYRTGWFYTYARAGAWTTSWTSYANGAGNQTTVHDAGGAGESGYTGAELPNQDVAVRLTVSWMSGSTTLFTSHLVADAVYNANNRQVCNGGSNIY
jgi:hypothetical protein